MALPVELMIPAVNTLPCLALPVELMIPAVNTLPPVMLPVALTVPPPIMFPLIPTPPVTTIVPVVVVVAAVFGALITTAMFAELRPPATNLILEPASTVANTKLPICPPATLLVTYMYASLASTAVPIALLAAATAPLNPEPAIPMSK